MSDLLSCGLQVTALELFDVDIVAAEEFLEVYKNVVSEFVVRLIRRCAGLPQVVVYAVGSVR